MDKTRTTSCYAVIFWSKLREGGEGYQEAAERMEALAAEQEGYVGIESVRDASGDGVTISYWESREAIARWRDHPEHRLIQERGRREWYAEYRLEVSRVERSLHFPA